MRYGYVFYSLNFYPKFKFVVGTSLCRYPFYIGLKPIKRVVKVRRITKRNFRRILKSYMFRDYHVHFSKIYN